MKQHFINYEYGIDKCTLAKFLDELQSKGHTINHVIPLTYRDSFNGESILISALIITSK